jgi:thiol-disulfide isomerase/thioredoxin
MASLQNPSGKLLIRKITSDSLIFRMKALIGSPVLSDKIFNYLVTYNRKGYSREQRENAYIEAVDAIMNVIEKDAGPGGAVYEFVLDYMVDGFERLGMNKVLAWIADHYADALCTGEEKTTLRRKLEAQKMVSGTIVPDFTLNDLEGQPVTFSQVLSERNLLIFWASWCPHCVTMLPLIKSVCSRKSNLEVIAVSLDNSGNEWQQAVTDAGIEQFINLSDLKKWDGKVAEDYNIYATPTMFLVDRHLKLLAVPTTPEELSKFLDSF